MATTKTKTNEEPAEAKPADPSQWDVKDTKEQRKHNMWGSLSQALADAFEEPNNV